MDTPVNPKSAPDPGWPASQTQHVCVASLSDMIAFDHSQCEQEHYIPCYRMNLQDVASGREAADAAILTGWLGLLQSNSQTVLMEVGTAREGGDLQAGCVAVTYRLGDPAAIPEADKTGAHGQEDRPEAFLRGLLEARALPEMDFCALNFLRIPGLLFQGFWLKSNDPKQPCRVCPLFSLENCLMDRVYTMPEFLDAIMPFARERMSQLDNSPLPVGDDPELG